MKKTASTLLDPRPLILATTALLLAAGAVIGSQARAQDLDPALLEDLVAPVALYPDDVLGIILPASTFPLDIVRAARFLEDLEEYPNLEPDEAWDDSVVALLNYPEVIEMMDQDLDWTWELGEAVLTDQAAVLAAAQSFRRRALAAGNLRTDDRQVVAESNGAIEIRPADPEVVYIPYYEPREVVVYQRRPVYHYYPVAYPVYYYPYPYGHHFHTGFFWGVTSFFSIGWHSHYVHVHHHRHYSHPYYVRTYYTPYYYRSGINITVNVDNHSNVWAANPRRGVRPRTITTESRRSIARTQRTVTTESQPNVRQRSSSQLGTARSSTAQTSQRRTTTATRQEARQEAARNRPVNERTRSEAARPAESRSVQSTTRSQLRSSASQTTTPAPKTTTPDRTRSTSSQRTTSPRTTSQRTTTRSTTTAPSTTRSSSGALAPRSSTTRSAPTRSSSGATARMNNAPAPRSSAPRQNSAPRTTSAPRTNSAPRQTAAPRQNSAPRQSNTVTPRGSATRSSTTTSSPSSSRRQR
ncbi:MAG: DUF3300 domain-containing protein [Gammaproteobacteria bacterium]|nr:DUF3300 domain-containing protein [Gammaproteobacteria bacterium]